VFPFVNGSRGVDGLGWEGVAGDRLTKKRKERSILPAEEMGFRRCAPKGEAVTLRGKKRSQAATADRAPRTAGELTPGIIKKKG